MAPITEDIYEEIKQNGAIQMPLGFLKCQWLLCQVKAVENFIISYMQ